MRYARSCLHCAWQQWNLYGARYMHNQLRMCMRYVKSYLYLARDLKIIFVSCMRYGQWDWYGAQDMHNEFCLCMVYARSYLYCAWDMGNHICNVAEIRTVNFARSMRYAPWVCDVPQMCNIRIWLCMKFMYKPLYATQESTPACMDKVLCITRTQSKSSLACEFACMLCICGHLESVRWNMVWSSNWQPCYACLDCALRWNPYLMDISLRHSEESWDRGMMCVWCYITTLIQCCT